MYTRPVSPNRGGISIPRNYSGTAFTEAEYTDLSASTVPEEDIKTAKKEEPVSKKLFGGASPSRQPPDGADCDFAPPAHKICPSCGKSAGECSCGALKHKDGPGRFFPSPNFKFDFGKLFSNGIGFEELLIIALIILFMQGDKNNDVIFLLVLLLFI